MKFTGPKAKKCRRQGVNLYGSDKYDRILQRKPYGPGKGPRDRSGRTSEYAQQLGEKQKARDIYGLSEKQFHRLYKEAARSPEQTGDALKMLLETRLDNVIYRSGLALTRLQARQFVSHGLFVVNGHRTTCPSYRVREGDEITVRDRTRGSTVFVQILDANDKYMPPGWLTVNTGNLTIAVKALPDAEAAEQAIDERAVIEYYSRR